MKTLVMVVLTRKQNSYLDVVHTEYIVAIIHVLFQILFLKQMTEEKEEDVSGYLKSLTGQRKEKMNDVMPAT